MKNFHAVCVDNFFDDPDKIREWGLGLSKEKDPEGKWEMEFIKMISKLFLIN